MAAPANPPHRPWHDDALSRLPGSLCKAITDNWTYRIGLRDGRAIECAQVRLDGRDWIELIEPRTVRGQWPVNLPMERRVFVRISEIVWCTEMDS
jgi:hypothetical protein